MEMELWNARKGTKPVWRDGLTTQMSYLIVAVHNKDNAYNCVCIRSLGDTFKVKFYPNKEAWNLTGSNLEEMGATCFLDRTTQRNAGYFRVYMDKEAVVKLMHRLAATRNVCSQKYDAVYTALETGLGKECSYKYHPTRGGGPMPLLASPVIEEPVA